LIPPQKVAIFRRKIKKSAKKSAIELTESAVAKLVERVALSVILRYTVRPGFAISRSNSDPAILNLLRKEDPPRSLKHLMKYAEEFGPDCRELSLTPWFDE
jgi:hypothetical protein